MSNKKTLEAGFVARAAAGIRFAFTGRSDWFGAGDPLPPQAQDAATGRQFDYEPFFNTAHSRPRQNEAVGFADLRALADNYDVLRLVIEKRKDQLERLNWTIQHRDAAATAKNESRRKDKRIDEAIVFFRRPDKENSWGEWLRILLEDLFVIDAPCTWPRKTLGGGLYALELVDGATVKRVLDDTGRTPLPPQTAYQQILRGMPAADYTRDELIYRPRNKRSYKVYGFSPVEQIIQTVNIALRRQVHTLEYYQSGSVPDALVGVPDTWTAEDIRRFQEYWDLLLSGESAQRRKMRFVSGDLARNFVETKQPPLKDMYDEWLARVVCFCFSIEPTPFVAQVNRATAETSREQSVSDGLLPLQNWVKSIVDDVLERFMDMADYEFVWQEETVQSPAEQAQIYAAYINAGVLTVDEVREELGKEPLPEEDKQTVLEPDNENGAMPSENDKPEQAAEETEAEKLGKSQRPITPEEAAALIEAQLVGLADETAEQIMRLLAENPVDRTAEDLEAEIARVIDAVSDGMSFAGWAGMAAVVEPIIRQAAFGAAEKALFELIPEPLPVQTAGIRSRAVQWAAGRSAEMVGMRRWAGKLVPNPNAEWQITEGTRGLIRQAVKEALENGDSTGELAARLKDSHAFSKARAETIARTETARADSMGTLIGWDESGLVSHKEWHTAEDDKVSDICNENGKAGKIGLWETFPSGDLEPPSHPNCRCVLLSVLKDGEDSDGLEKSYDPNQPRDKNGRWTSGGSWGLSEISDGAHADLNRKELHQIGAVGNENVEAVKKQIAVDLAGYGREVHDDELRHVTNSHGNHTYEKARGQRAVTKDDLNKLPDVVSKPDEVKNGSVKWMCLPTIKYRKVYKNETFVYVEAVRAKRKQVRFVSLRIHSRKR